MAHTSLRCWEKSFIDGDYANSPYSDRPRSAAIRMNHSSCNPNARVETRPVPGGGQRLILIATEAIEEEGREIRINYESGGPKYWKLLLGGVKERPRRPAGRDGTQACTPTTCRDDETDAPAYAAHGGTPVRANAGTAPSCCGCPKCDPCISRWEASPWEGDAAASWHYGGLVALFHAAEGQLTRRTWWMIATHLPGRTRHECMRRARQLRIGRDFPPPEIQRSLHVSQQPPRGIRILPRRRQDPRIRWRPEQ